MNEPSPLGPAEWRFLEEHRVARLGTADANGRPHVVPVVYAVVDASIVIALDEKPKRVAPTELRRVRNLRVNPQVAFLVDDYSEDWSRLAYVLVRGSGTVVQPGEGGHASAVARLREKYPQYEHMSLEERPLIRIVPAHASAWPGSGQLGPVEL
jgi:coenzyme F420-0:L-glutamate ligase/coenzyme F420-1:gamma-L-glutamate ligase